jgi:predicted enzyme related to lactoylglutathione lyase
MKIFDNPARCGYICSVFKIHWGCDMDQVTGFEIPVDNEARAKKFFKDVFGWKLDNWGEGMTGITTVDMDDNWVPKEKGAVNGMMYKRKTKNETPLIMVTVDSIDKTITKVKKLKGKVVTAKTEAGEWGWWAEVMDTEGNILELWEDTK